MKKMLSTMLVCVGVGAVVASVVSRVREVDDAVKMEFESDFASDETSIGEKAVAFVGTLIPACAREKIRSGLDNINDAVQTLW